MSKVRRIYVEKKDAYAVKAKDLKKQFKDYLGIKADNVRVLTRYDMEGVSEDTYNKAKVTIFSEPPIDVVYEESFPMNEKEKCFSQEYLPGQFDQRADSAEQCVKLLNEEETPVIKTATTYVVEGDVTEEQMQTIREYVVNPVDSRLTDETKPETLVTNFEEPADVKIFDGFKDMPEAELKALYDSLGLAMTIKDFEHFVKPFAALIRRLLPDKAHKVVEGAQYLDPKLIEATPGIAVEAVKNECAYMGFLVIHLLDSVQEVFFNDKKDLIPKIEETEAKIDQLHKAVKAYAEDIMQAGISDDAARVLTLYVASSGNIERIGDYGKKLLEYYAYRQNRPKDFSQQAMTELSGMYAEAHHAIVTALDGFINDDPDKAREVAPIAGKLRGLEVELRNRHIQRLDKQECDSETGLVYVDILGIIEHIGYHSNNVAKATISSCTAEHKAKA